MQSERVSMDERWHLSRSVSLGHIVTTLGMIVAAFWYLATTDSRIGAIERDQQYLRGTVTRVEQQQKEQGDRLTEQLNLMKVEIKRDIQAVDIKLDKLIEREINRVSP